MRFRTAACSSLLILTSVWSLASARADEPPQNDANRQAAAAALGAISDDPAALAQLSASLVDVGDSLVAANGLGVDVSPPEAALRAQLGLEEKTGLVVTAVPPESDGAKAGLQVHDLILQLGNEKPDSATRLKELLDASDGPVKLRILRGGKTLDLEAAPRKPEVIARLGSQRLWGALVTNNVVQEERYRLGVSLSAADDTLRTQLRLAAGEGLVVTEVVGEGAAKEAGVKQHDVLTVLGGQRLTTVEAINAQIQEIKEKPVTLRLLRSGQEITLEVTPRKMQEAAMDHPFVYWDTKNCQACHATNHATQAAHLLLGRNLHAAHSAWTDGHHARMYLNTLTALKPDAQREAATGTQEQLQALKGQLAEMHRAVAALEAALAPAAPKPEEKKE